MQRRPICETKLRKYTEFSLTLMNSYEIFTTNKVTQRINPSENWFKWNMNGLKIFYANVNRLVSDKRRESFLVYLESLKISFDVLVLVETFYENEINILNIPGFCSYHTIRQQHGGGVSIYLCVRESHIKKAKIDYIKRQRVPDCAPAKA